MVTFAPLTDADYAANPVTPDLLRRALVQVIDPEIGVNIVDLGLIYELDVNERNEAYIEMTLTTPGCPLSLYIEDEINNAVARFTNLHGVEVDLTFQPAWNAEMMSDTAKSQLGWR